MGDEYSSDLSTICEDIIEEELERLKISRKEMIDSNNSLCPICLESLIKIGTVCQLPCHHMFHYE